MAYRHFGHALRGCIWLLRGRAFGDAFPRIDALPIRRYVALDTGGGRRPIRSGEVDLLRYRRYSSMARVFLATRVDYLRRSPRTCF